MFPARPAFWPLLALIHLVAAALGLGFGPARSLWNRFALRFPRTAMSIGDWYPLVLVPAIYMELAVLNQAVFGGRYFDNVIIRWEQAVFHTQPSRTLAPAAPFRPLSEVLHAAYLSYYLIVMAPPVILALQRRWAEFREMVFTVMFAFFAHYLFFVYFPVQGPRYLFPPPGSGQAEGPAFRLAHEVLQAGSSQGSAFPSSHVGVSVAQAANMLRFLPRLAPLVIVLTLGLGTGAVYGGFHYAIDALAGLALGTACAVIGPSLYRRLLPAESRRSAAPALAAR